MFGLLIPIVAAGILSASGCKPNPGTTPTPSPIATSTPGPYSTWSTNFSDITDPPAQGISGWASADESLSMETASVQSGGKAVKLAGTVEKAWDGMSLNISLTNLTGADTLDLSNKTLKVEVLVPQGSPLHYFYVDVNGLDQNNTQQYVRARFFESDPYMGQWHTYIADVNEDIALKAWREWPNNASPNITDDQAIQVFKHAKSIAVICQTTQDHPPTQTYFLVDSLGWAPSGPLPAYNDSVDSLRRFAPARLPVGGWNEISDIYDPDVVRNFVQEFNLILTTNRFPQAEPAGDAMNYDFTWSPKADDDTLHDIQGMALLRYSGIGQNPAWQPDWLPDKDYEEAKPILEGYIRSLVSHYKGKTYIWNLFNEALAYDLDDRAYPGLGLKSRTLPSADTPKDLSHNYSPWAKDDSDVSLIEDAFRVARQADPHALLILNEPAPMEGDAYGEAVYALVAKLKADGTPIDGVGLETHFEIDQNDRFMGFTPIPFDPTYGFTDIAAQVERFAALGLKVVFTEADLPIYLGDIDPTTQAGQDLLAHRRQLQAAGYRSLLHIALTHPTVVGFVIFEWQDEYSYNDPAITSAYSGYGKDLGLFDQYFQKKPSYTALLDELKANAAAPAKLPRAFTRSSPPDGITGLPLNVLLRWNRSPGARAYQYCLMPGKVDHCDSWISTGTETSVAVSLPLPAWTYSWQVRALGPGGVVHANHGNWGNFRTIGQESFTYTTNFAHWSDLSAYTFNFNGQDASGSLDTSNVHSGGKSVKMTVTLGSASPNFELRLYLKDLIGVPAYDLSNKTISFEVYLPADSPLDFLTFTIRQAGRFVNIDGVSGLYKGGWHTYTIDISQVLAGQAWRINPDLIASGMTDADVLSTLQNADSFALYGGLTNPGADQVTSILLDQVSWSGH